MNDNLFWTHNSHQVIVEGSLEIVEWWTYSSELGTATVEHILDNKWRWEAHSNNSLQNLDMDCWWGIEKTSEAAKNAAERELKRWFRK